MTEEKVEYVSRMFRVEKQLLADFRVEVVRRHPYDRTAITIELNEAIKDRLHALRSRTNIQPMKL
jgi:hypothetical protein